MSETLLEHQTLIRGCVFFGVLIAMSILEAMFPKKKRTQARQKRWPTNLSIIILDTVLSRLASPFVALAIAALAGTQNWGLFNILSLPIALEIILCMALLDMAIYWQHVAFHKIPVLWSLHKVHHVDRDIDASTGVRFHPIEIVLSMIYKALIILILGAPLIAVFLFEVILNASAIFNHANLKLPKRVDQFVRFFFVTPDMHRVHHSIIQRETNSNYGFNLSLWDRIFQSYIPQPQMGHQGMIIGLESHQSDKPSSLWWSLTLPFHKTVDKNED